MDNQWHDCDNVCDYPPCEKDFELRKNNKYLVKVRSGSFDPVISYQMTYIDSPQHFNIEMDWVKVLAWMPIPKLSNS